MQRRSDIEAAYLAAGCRVYPGNELGDLGAACVRADCVDGWGAARVLAELAKRDAATPEVQRLATTLRAGAWGTRAAIGAAYDLVRGIEFRKEAGEVFQSPAVTLARRYGDCDCHVRLLVALLRAMGVPARFAFLSAPGGPPLHVVAQAWDGAEWLWLETTVKGARLGEHPISAAYRAGKMRPDIQSNFSEVTTMGEIEETENHEHADGDEESVPSTQPETATRGPATDGVYVPRERTPIDKATFAHAARVAWPEASREAIGVLWAQYALETGRGQSCWNNNIGNVKKVNGDGRNYTMLPRVPEYINGKKVYFDPPHPQTWFRVYPTLADGMAEHLALLRKRYARAWKFVEAGDPAGFAAALKIGGYYTGSADEYIAALVSLQAEWLRDAATKLALPIGGLLLIAGAFAATLYGVKSVG